MLREAKNLKLNEVRVELIFSTIVFVIFFIIGLSFFSICYIHFRDIDIYKKTPITSITDIKEGEVVKIVLKSQSDVILETPHTKIPCVFYHNKYISYHLDSDGCMSSRLDKEKKQPSNLFLELKDKKYSISLIKPEAELFFKQNVIYLKDPIYRNYKPVEEDKICVGANTLEESVIYPNEDVLVFGKVKKMLPDKIKNITTIEFEKVELPDVFINLKLFYSTLYKVLFEGDSTCYVVSTLPDDILIEELGSSDRITYPALFALGFCFIPLFIIIPMWRSYFKKFKT